MDIQQPLDRLAQELKRRGLPQEYVARYVDELNDHIIDLIEERRSGMSKDAPNSDALNTKPTDWNEIAARIGDPATLAEAASVEFSRRTFCGRHPVLMFLLAPLPLAVLAWAAMFAASFGLMAGIVAIAQWLGGDADMGVTVARWPTGVVWMFATLFVLSATAPPAALTVLLCRLANRSGLSWRWSLAACLVLALVAGMFQASFGPPVTVGDGDGRIMLGFGMWLFPPVQQLLQFALPLAIGLGLVWRQTHPPHGRPFDAPQADMANRQAA